ncbi:hypothetical protein BDW02DRAFT_625668 [Decorospora gaudefroyi]|uniref:Uncharacterized protein n=1 Tax=Decorospora gaudefroyi TaxID=184978 RepID=A0A6A5K7F4_9PLEO|nr:hypothetical protein BDW02DRAFT_625668 [Decorospora gaudefroyi]
MPHFTPDETHVLNPTTNPTPSHEYPQESTTAHTPQTPLHHRESHNSFNAAYHLGPFELEATPTQHTSFSLSSFENAYTTLLTEAITNLQTAHKRYNDTTTALQTIKQHVFYLNPPPPPHTSLAKPTPHLSHASFLQLLRDKNLSYLAPYTDELNADMNFAADPEGKRCRVGRPRGKVLREDQGDDLKRRLCCLHCSGEGFEMQVYGQGRDPWVCYPVNARDEEEV